MKYWLLFGLSCVLLFAGILCLQKWWAPFVAAAGMGLGCFSLIKRK